MFFINKIQILIHLAGWSIFLLGLGACGKDATAPGHRAYGVISFDVEGPGGSAIVVAPQGNELNVSPGTGVDVTGNLEILLPGGIPGPAFLPLAPEK
jgi:hypothetical protein